MCGLVDGVRDVILYPSASDKSKNRGFAFVEFERADQAASARAALGDQRGSLWGKTICVDWAAPEPEVDPSLMATVKVLYVRNLMLSTSEETIRAHFDQLQPGTVERVKKLKDFAFVHYTSRRFALANMAALNGSVLEGAVLEVQLAKPTDRAAKLSAAAAAQLAPHQAAFSTARPFVSPAPAVWQMKPPPSTTAGIAQWYPAQLRDPHPYSAAGLYSPVDNGPGTPFVDTADPLAAQKARVELLARHSDLEAKKLAIMQQERLLAVAWARQDVSPVYTPTPNGHNYASFFPAHGQASSAVHRVAPAHKPQLPKQLDLFATQPQNTGHHQLLDPPPPPPPAFSFGRHGRGAPLTPQPLIPPSRPISPNTNGFGYSPGEPVGTNHRLSGGGGDVGAGQASQGSSPGLSSVSSGGQVPSFGGLSALAPGQPQPHLSLEDAMEHLRLSSDEAPGSDTRDNSPAQPTATPLFPSGKPLYSSHFAASSPVLRGKTEKKIPSLLPATGLSDLGPELVTPSYNPDSGLGLEYSSKLFA